MEIERILSSIKPEYYGSLDWAIVTRRPDVSFGFIARSQYPWDLHSIIDTKPWTQEYILARRDSLLQDIDALARYVSHRFTTLDLVQQIVTNLDTCEDKILDAILSNPNLTLQFVREHYAVIVARYKWDILSMVFPDPGELLRAFPVDVMPGFIAVNRHTTDEVIECILDAYGVPHTVNGARLSLGEIKKLNSLRKQIHYIGLGLRNDLTLDMAIEILGAEHLSMDIVAHPRIRLLDMLWLWTFDSYVSCGISTNPNTTPEFVLLNLVLCWDVEQVAISAPFGSFELWPAVFDEHNAGLHPELTYDYFIARCGSISLTSGFFQSVRKLNASTSLSNG